MKIDKYKYKLFGRFRGRKRQPNLSSNFKTKYEFKLENNINKKKYNILDIGSGSGENAIFLSNIYPKAKIITCELFEDGNINLLHNIDKNKIANISLYHGNVLKFLDSLDDINIFNEIWILFPDPWPKKRHHKRRLINETFLKEIHKFLKSSGNVNIASDSSSYLGSMLETIYNLKLLYLWNNQRFEEWNYSFLDLPKTKFYKKSIKSDRNSMFFKLNKI